MNDMLPVLTAEAMRKADRFTIDHFGIDGRVLMEIAGREAALIIERRYGPASSLSIAIFCGKGNNGGDGFVAARYLHQHGADVHVVTLGAVEDLSEDAAANLQLLHRLTEREGSRRLKIDRFGHQMTIESIPVADVYVDALLGTGVTSALRDPIDSIVRHLAERPGAKVAIDIPTGLHTDKGVELNFAFRADLTITMGARKAGLCINAGSSVAGTIETVDIGIPRGVLSQPPADGDAGSAFLSTDRGVGPLLPRRSAGAHKYSVGYAFLVAGSVGMTGAPIMAASAAARAGAGYVTCACDSRIQEVLSVKTTEITSIGLPTSEDGILPEEAMATISDRLSRADAVLIGCGLGRGESTAAFVRRFAEDVKVPLVLDADGINAFAGRTDLIREQSNGRWILTPHMGEFTRLAGDALERSGLPSDDRIRIAQHFAREWNCVLVLKGMPSVVAAPNGRSWINGTGNPGLATAGTGDVLAGICVGLLAQGVAPVDAAVAGVHLGGACADRYAERRDLRTMLATDLIDQLPFVLKERFPVYG